MPSNPKPYTDIDEMIAAQERLEAKRELAVQQQRLRDQRAPHLTGKGLLRFLLKCALALASIGAFLWWAFSWSLP